MDKYMETILKDSSVISGKMHVKVSKELYLQGIIGPTILESKDPKYPKDENVIGEGGGNVFMLNSALDSSTYNMFFQHTSPSIPVKQKSCYF